MITDIPNEIRERLSNVLSTPLKDFTFSGGGCINHGGRLSTFNGDFFIKWNSKDQFPGMFEAEAKGLKLLAQPEVIHIPKVIATNATETFQFIILEFVEEKSKVKTYWRDLGKQLAQLHKNSAPTFGLDHNNYIGSLTQNNTLDKNWINFFSRQRLEVQLKLARDNSRISTQTIQQFEILFKKLPQILPEEKPSLLHGDLWNGNLITNSIGEPCLIDPAVYYGHREAEIAFTRLFGGFAEEFYKTYHDNFPLSPGFNARSDVYNLYPLMVHVNLFGGSYPAQVVSILKKYV